MVPVLVEKRTRVAALWRGLGGCEAVPSSACISSSLGMIKPAWVVQGLRDAPLRVTLLPRK